MSSETLFQICNTAVLPCWLLLFVAPHWRWTQRICAYTVPMLLAVLYIWLFIVEFNTVFSGFGSLGAVKYLFQNPTILVMGWVHYLAFDLVVGSWETREAKRLGIPHFAVIPCLVLTFLLGPAGFLLFCLLRVSFWRDRVAKPAN